MVEFFGNVANRLETLLVDTQEAVSRSDELQKLCDDHGVSIDLSRLKVE